jgi:hypothetical protein
MGRRQGPHRRAQSGILRDRVALALPHLLDLRHRPQVRVPRVPRPPVGLLRRRQRPLRR